MHKQPAEQTTEEWMADYNRKSEPPFHPPTTTASVTDIPLSNKDSDEGIVEEKALIPAGEYQALYLSHELHPNFHGFGDKLVISYSVVDSDYAGEIILSYYNITILETGFKAKGGSNWVKDMRRLFPHRKRKDRLPPSLLKNRKVLVEVRTIVTGRGKRILQKEEQYSIVANILRLLN